MTFLSFQCEEYFRTSSSVSYGLVRNARGIIKDLPPGDNHTVEFGRVEMHWGANTHIRIYIRVDFAKADAVPISRSDFKIAAEKFIADHALSSLCTYEAEILYWDRAITVENRTDSAGRIDRI
jgi:hypothetical protein